MPSDPAARFAAAVARTTGPIAVFAHFDADGLAAAAILARALDRAGREAVVRIVGKGESAWDGSLAAGLAARRPGLAIVADLGVREGTPMPGVPLVVIDHHVPAGTPDALVLSGHGETPEPTTALLAWRAAAGIASVDDLLWLAAIGLIGDMAEGAGFAELADAQARWGKTALRDAVALVNAPRRTAAADASPALRLLMRGDGPKAITRGEDADARALAAARAEVQAALAEAKRAAPRIAGEVALIAFASPCQIHPLVAQAWRGRLKDRIVIAANTGYRDGWVHFAARTALPRDLVAFLAGHRPPGADDRYGNGHRAATGGALRLDDWRAFVAGLGFAPERAAA